MKPKPTPELNWEFEKQAGWQNMPWIVGLDEVGRGCLAGPVVTCALALPFGWAEAKLADSKALNSRKREELWQVLLQSRTQGHIHWETSYGSVDQIDKINILHASEQAMSAALSKLCTRVQHLPSQCLIAVDGHRTLQHVSCSAVVGGDSKVVAIAGASVIAKVVRDRWMKLLDASCPGYGFAVNKGYGTIEHRKALAKLGPTVFHRRSFSPVRQPTLPGLEWED